MLIKKPETQVVAVLVSSTRVLNMSVQLYGEKHHEVKFAAIITTGQELLRLLGEGLSPTVIVLDAPLDDMELPDLLARVARLVPDVAVLLSVRVPCEDSLEPLLLTFPRHRIMLMPWGVSEMYGYVYRLGVGGRAGDAYIVSNTCSRLLDSMQADSRLVGRTYLQEMVACTILAEHSCGIGELKQTTAQQYGTDVEAVTSALNRVNQRMYQRGTALYRRFAIQNGKAADERLPLGDLVKSLANEVRYRLDR